MKKDLTGMVFGSLRVVERIDAGPKKSKWKCEHIVTGQTRNVMKGDLVSGKIADVSCRHGKSKTAEYAIWEAMNQRCNNKNHKAYKNYGGRGIRVCDRWKNAYLFIVDMGKRPDGHTLDRIDNNGNYEPSNCRWVPFIENQNNKRSNHYMIIDGIRMSRADFCRKYKIKPKRAEYLTLVKDMSATDILRLEGKYE